MIRIGLVRPWSWDEWLGLSEDFSESVLDVFGIIQELETARAEQATPTGRVTPEKPDVPVDVNRDALADLSRVVE